MTGALLDWVEPEDFFMAHVAGRRRVFWLDGSGARPWSGRMSYVGWLDDHEASLTLHAATATVREHRNGRATWIGNDIFAALADRRGAATARGGAPGWVGCFGYAARPDLPAQVDERPEAVDAVWLRATRWVEFDHAARTVRAVSTGDPAGRWADDVRTMLAETRPAPPPAHAVRSAVEATWDPAAYAEAFGRVQHELRVGNSYETNLTYRMLARSAADPVDTYRRLRALSPAPYSAYISHEGTSLLSSSPERFVTIWPDGRVETRPIKGTTPRDPDPDRDAAAAARLRREPKFRGENLMIVDLLRNDMSRVCAVGSVDVTDLMHVESYPSVHQLVTTIVGRLRSDVNVLGALYALFPGGSMTGAPKLRTMQIIADVEASPRGLYSGAVGWLRDDGSADLGIVIRSLVHRDTTYELGTGGGITVHSDPDEEYAETTWKAASLLRVLGLDP